MLCLIHNRESFCRQAFPPGGAYSSSSGAGAATFSRQASFAQR